MAASYQLNIRIDDALRAKLDALAARRSMPGLNLSRSDAGRVALAVGLEKLDAEDGVAVAAKKPPAPRRR